MSGKQRGSHMRIEKINENKIKVLIDDKEAEEWNVSFKKISQNLLTLL